jgi:hypothetical protein
MSYTKDITVWCDYCPEWIQPNTMDDTIAKARKSIKREGWVFLDGKDVCPVCKVDSV